MSLLDFDAEELLAADGGPVNALSGSMDAWYRLLELFVAVDVTLIALARDWQECLYNVLGAGLLVDLNQESS